MPYTGSQRQSDGMPILRAWTPKQGDWAAKLSRKWADKQRSSVSNSNRDPSNRRVVAPRSFNRACLRALENGTTQYKGRWFDSTQ